MTSKVTGRPIKAHIAFLPPYSSFLNAIEFVWHMLERQVRHRMREEMHKSTDGPAVLHPDRVQCIALEELNRLGREKQRQIDNIIARILTRVIPACIQGLSFQELEDDLRKNIIDTFRVRGEQ